MDNEEKFAILVEDSSRVVVSNNKIFNHTAGHVIAIKRTSDVSVDNNQIHFKHERDHAIEAMKEMFEKARKDQEEALHVLNQVKDAQSKKSLFDMLSNMANTISVAEAIKQLFKFFLS